MKTKNKKLVKALVILAIFIAALVAIIFWNILYARHWKYTYYGNEEGVQVEILFSPFTPRNSKNKGTADDNSWCEIWIKSDKNTGMLHNIVLESSKFSLIMGPYEFLQLTPEKWVRCNRSLADTRNIEFVTQFETKISFSNSPDKKSLITINTNRVPPENVPFVPPCNPELY